MTLFAENNHKQGGIAIELGRHGSKWGFFDDKVMISGGAMERLTDWHKVKLELDDTSGVKLYIDDEEKLSTTSVLKEGKLRFLANCRTMLIRNIKVTRNGK